MTHIRLIYADEYSEIIEWQEMRGLRITHDGRPWRLLGYCAGYFTYEEEDVRCPNEMPLPYSGASNC